MCVVLGIVGCLHGLLTFVCCSSIKSSVLLFVNKSKVMKVCWAAN